MRCAAKTSGYTSAVAVPSPSNVRRPSPSGPVRRAVITGLVLGISVGVHTTQFILQFPLLMVFTWLWLRRQPLPSTIPYFAATLAAAVQPSRKQ